MQSLEAESLWTSVGEAVTLWLQLTLQTRDVQIAFSTLEQINFKSSIMILSSFKFFQYLDVQ